MTVKTGDASYCTGSELRYVSEKGFDEETDEETEDREMTVSNKQASRCGRSSSGKGSSYSAVATVATMGDRCKKRLGAKNVEIDGQLLFNAAFEVDEFDESEKNVAV
jgi:hypothetical protein